jgi:hypothetical protein
VVTQQVDLSTVESKLAESEGTLKTARTNYERLKTLHGILTQKADLTPEERDLLNGSPKLAKADADLKVTDWPE